MSMTSSLVKEQRRAIKGVLTAHADDLSINLGRIPRFGTSCAIKNR